MKALNLYAGIGGNRKLWTDVEVTAVELNPQIAKIYQDFFPQDKVIVADAHQYLLEHFKEYDFIWSSPPCPSHSRIRKHCAVGRGQNDPIYPDMKLYQEILLLKHYYKGKWCIENVIAFYEPLIKPSDFGNHWFWHNFHIRPIATQGREHDSKIDVLEQRKGFDLSKVIVGGLDKKLLLRNCVEPELGLHILNESKREEYGDLFK
jgi:DNA (cytosine-5)-methyltransferase 1